VNIVGVEADAGQQIVRKWMVHLLDANFGSGTPAWYRFGRDLQEYNVDLNPDTEVRKNICGNTSFVHNGYEPSGENDTFYAHKSLFSITKCGAFTADFSPDKTFLPSKSGGGTARHS
jgi:hypothetical protein